MNGSNGYPGNYSGPPGGAFSAAPYDQGGEFSDGKQKKRRGNLPKAVTDILRAWFTDHIGHPYPSEDEKHMLMDRTGLTMSQVSLADLVSISWYSSRLT